MEYINIQDKNSEQEKKSIAEVLKVPYEDIRKKVFDILNSYNVSEETIKDLMNYTDTWIDLYKEKENIIDYMRKNMPNEQPEKQQVWEVSLPAMLDY